MSLKWGQFVKENKNHGVLASRKEETAIKSAQELIQIANSFNIKIKQHNADYLSEEDIHFFNKIGVHAINIAPEFGFIETKFILNKLDEYSLYTERKNLIEYLVRSNKWRRWVFEDKKYDSEFLANIIGHYFFFISYFLKIFLKKYKDAILKLKMRSWQFILSGSGQSFVH